MPLEQARKRGPRGLAVLVAKLRWPVEPLDARGSALRARIRLRRRQALIREEPALPSVKPYLHQRTRFTDGSGKFTMRAGNSPTGAREVHHQRARGIATERQLVELEGRWLQRCAQRQMLLNKHHSTPLHCTSDHQRKTP
eukprot:7464298-Pyramimonas_sp.AAC.2